MVLYSEDLINICMPEIYNKTMESIVEKVTENPDICSKDLISHMNGNEMVLDILQGSFENIYCTAVKKDTDYQESVLREMIKTATMEKGNIK